MRKEIFFLMSHAAKKNLILAKASQGKLSHRSGLRRDQQYSSAINTDAEPSCQSVKLNDQCEVIDEISQLARRMWII